MMKHISTQSVSGKKQFLWLTGSICRAVLPVVTRNDLKKKTKIKKKNRNEADKLETRNTHTESCNRQLALQMKETEHFFGGRGGGVSQSEKRCWRQRARPLVVWKNGRLIAAPKQRRHFLNNLTTTTREVSSFFFPFKCIFVFHPAGWKYFWLISVIFVVLVFKWKRLPFNWPLTVSNFFLQRISLNFI